MHDDRYGVLFDSYWTGPTGREIQARGRDAVILGAYLGSTRHATMIGLYELPVLYVAADLPVLGADAIRRAFADLAAVGFARFDERSGVVWVVEMARIRCGLAPGEILRPGDKKRIAATAQYARVRPNPFLGAFFDRYAVQLGLSSKRDDSIPLPSPIEAPPISGSGSGSGNRISKQEQVPRARLLRSPTEAPSEELAPMDEWARELVKLYPAQGRCAWNLVERPLYDALMSDPETQPRDAWRVLQTRLDEHKRSHQWAMKGMIPRLDRWLREGMYLQELPTTAPTSERLSAKSSRTLTAAANILKEPGV